MALSPALSGWSRQVSPVEEGDEAEPDQPNSEEPRLQAAQIRKGFKKPKLWMLTFGFVLAACAGTVNVIAFQELGTVVSHLTGALTKTAMELEGVHDIAKYDPTPASEHALAILSFVFGAFLC